MHTLKTAKRSTNLHSSNFLTSSGMWRAVRTSGVLRYMRRSVPLVQGGSSCTGFLRECHGSLMQEETNIYAYINTIFLWLEDTPPLCLSFFHQLHKSNSLVLSPEHHGAVEAVLPQNVWQVCFMAGKLASCCVRAIVIQVVHVQSLIVDDVRGFLDL